MSCRICQSDNQRELGGETGIRSKGLENVGKPAVFVFPDLLVCLDCGFTEFLVPETELRQLMEIIGAGTSPEFHY
jgi:hypothetical protein